MSEIEILENLKKYLQFLLDSGTHKIFYNDLFWSEKTIDCINAINDLQQENKQLKSILTELEEWLKEQWYEIEPKGTGINFNCEYDSEEDYVRGMETKSKLDTLKNSLNKIQELKEKYK